MIKIAIHSVPRSGSSWVGQILNSHPNVAYRYQPLFSYKFKDRLVEESSSEEVDQFFEDIYKTNDDFVLQNVSSKVSFSNNDNFSKNEITHIVYKEVRYHNLLENMLRENKELKVIGLVRNPYAVINSWLSAPREFRADLDWNELDEWNYASKKNKNRKEEFNGFLKWLEVIYLFNDLNNKYSDRFYLLNYKNLLNEPDNEILKLFNFAKLSFGNSTAEYIKKSRSFDDYDIYGTNKIKHNDDLWKTTLNPKIIDEVGFAINNSRIHSFINQFI